MKDAGKVRASVFLVHGMQDLNVRTKHFGQWWDALAKHGVERKIWLSQTGHVDPFDYRRARLGRHPAPLVRPRTPRLRQRHRPRADGRHRAPPRPVGHLRGLAAARHHGPPPCARPRQRRRASAPWACARAPGTETFTDDPQPSETDWAAHDHRPTPDKAGFVTGPLTRDLRLSGSSPVTVTATPTHLHRAPVRRPGRPRPRHHPRLRGQRRGHHHPHRAAPAGARAPPATAPASRRPRRRRPTSTTPSSAVAGPTSATTPRSPRASRSPRARRTP